MIEMNHTIVLKLETLNGALSYLGRRPYTEVEAIIGRIAEDLELLNGKERSDNGDEGTDRGE